MQSNFTQGGDLQRSHFANEDATRRPRHRPREPAGARRLRRAFRRPRLLGKTTLVRAMIAHLAGSVKIEVPSPTFTLVQAYDPRPVRPRACRPLPVVRMRASSPSSASTIFPAPWSSWNGRTVPAARCPPTASRSRSCARPGCALEPRRQASSSRYPLRRRGSCALAALHRLFSTTRATRRRRPQTDRRRRVEPLLGERLTVDGRTFIVM